MGRRATIDARAALRPVGIIVAGLGIGMALCAVVGGLMQWMDPRELDQGSVEALVLSAVITGASGVLLWSLGRGARSKNLGRREAVLTVALIWVLSGVFGGIPLVLHPGLPPVDAFFEAISGFTTTGATIIGDIEGTMSRPVLLWRALMQWLGGMGIVVLFVAIFPNIGVGAKHMFRSEVPGPTAEGLQPRIAETGITLWLLYLAITVLQVLVLWVLGMSLFDAVCHAFTTMSTGGFSTRDASIGAWGSAPIELAVAFFMLVAGVNFGLYYAVLRHRTLKVFLRSTEFKAYVGIAAVTTVALTIAILPLHPNLFQSFRYAVFTVATFLTSTGYGTWTTEWGTSTASNYMDYSPFAQALILLIMLVGASAGSTAGGIKVARVVLLTKMTWGQLRRSFRPLVVHVVRMGRQVVEESVLYDVAAFLMVYMMTLGAGTLLVALIDGTPVATSFGATLSCVSNMGPAPYWVGVDNFVSYSDLSKLIFSLDMLLGRLEMFTLLALLLPDFWRR